MSGRMPLSPKTPLPNQSKRRSAFSPTFTSSPGCSSTPNTSNGCGNNSSPVRRILWSKGSPARSSKPLNSPAARRSFHSQDSRSPRHSRSLSKENDTEKSTSFSKNASSTDPSWSVTTFSSTESNGTVTVELDFPHGGWDEDEDSSNGSSSRSLEIVESEAECQPSPIHRGRKRKQSEVSEEDNAILSGMGEEIERQLEAKAERNRLTVPNVKNILRTVITNPYVQAMVRRSIKSGDISVSGDLDMTFEPIMTRAKAKLLSDDATISDVSWAGTPLKAQPPSECQALISEELDDSEDDEEYQPGEDEHSDNEYSEREGSERGSERDMSMEQPSPAFCDTDTESCPATPTPSPKPYITDSATQTNWSEDGVFKVPSLPPEPQQEEENIALRTRSKLPLNDTPLEEIEQAFVPPDITPDLYDVPCDNEDWQEFLKEFMQPMRSEPEIPNHEDDDDPEYNVLADEEIIDKEELRKDRAVRVSKRELNELMRELLEFTETLSSDEDEKKGNGEKNEVQSKEGSSNSILTGNEDMSLFLDAYMSLGSITPMASLKTTPPTRSPSTPTLNTPVPPLSPPCGRTPDTGKKIMSNEVNTDQHGYLSQNREEVGHAVKGKVAADKKHGPDPSIDQGNTITKGMCGSQSGKKMNVSNSLGKLSPYPNSVPTNQSQNRVRCTPGKPNKFPESVSETRSKMSCTPGKLETVSNSLMNDDGQLMFFTPGKLESYFDEFPKNDENNFESIGMVGANTPICAVENNNETTFSPGKQYYLMNPVSHWQEDSVNFSNPSLETQITDKSWVETDGQNKRYETSSVQVDDTSPPEDCQNEKYETLSVQVEETAPPEDAQNERFETLSVQVEETPPPEDFPNKRYESLSVQREEITPPEDTVSSGPDESVSLAMSSEPPSPGGSDSNSHQISGDCYLSPQGDVVLNGQVMLSSIQRLLLDQQMRQHVQLLTQCFLQTYQHPVHEHHALPCKQKLEYLNNMAKDKRKSAFKPANLTPALEVINCWEQKLSSDEGPEIMQFMKDEVAKGAHLKKRRQKTVLKFPPQLLNLMSQSKAFIYPKLLPHLPFVVYERNNKEVFRSEQQLIALGLEEFTQFITDNDPKSKGSFKRAFEYMSEYLVVAREPASLWNFYRRSPTDESSPIRHFLKHKCAPPTSHVVIPFDENKMICLRDHPYHYLPELWGDFMYEQAKQQAKQQAAVAILIDL
ncbi:GON-4-like protein [Frankliniella fusca]|uniref:GON-4-like protein n=1 Tax=Frankliniella fusca TaxID=407009 RepID=A0AAE1H0Y6_9NEOP|nr:GON-4-like protein [Frankliniella fusca]